MGWTDKVRSWFGRSRDEGAKSYSVQMIVGDDGFMVAPTFNGSDLYRVFTQAIWTYICANRISKDVTTFPAIVQERKPGTDQWVTNTGHELYDLLYRPFGTSAMAPRLDWQQSVATGVLRQELGGMQQYITTSAGRRLLLLALSMDRLTANVDTSTGLFDTYSVAGSSAKIPVDNVVNIMHPNPSSLWSGVTPTVANEQATRVNFSADRRNRYDLETRVRPGVVFKVRSLFTMTSDQKVEAEEWLASQFAGATNQGKSMVVGDNIEVEDGPMYPVDDIPVKDAAARDKVVASYDIAPPMVGILDKANYSNLDKFMRIQFSNCIGPRLLNIYNTINSQGVWPVYGRDTRIWFDMVQSPLGLAALAERGETARIYFDMGWPAKQVNDRFDLQMPEFEGWDRPNMPAVVAGRVPGEGSGDPAPEEPVDETDGDDE